jgi:3-oxoacid CoA-transferase B subunit
VRERDAPELVLVCNSLGAQPSHPVTLVRHGQVRKLIAAFSARAGAVVESAQSLSPVPLEVELVPQGILVERLRCAGAGLGPFYSPVGHDTVLAEGKERRDFDGQGYVLEEPLRLDFALIYASKADRAGNLVFRGANQNFGPSFAKAASIVALHAENGLLGYGARLRTQEADEDIYNAASEPVALRGGASAFDTVEAFEMARGGRLDAVVLGAYQVAADGSFANWTTPQMDGGAIGGAMDLVVRPGKLVIAMWHCERSGRPKVVRHCRYPVTGTGCVDLVVTDLAVIERDERGLVLRECAAGFTADEVARLTDAPLTVELWEEMKDSNRSRYRCWLDSFRPRGDLHRGDLHGGDLNGGRRYRRKAEPCPVR